MPVDYQGAVCARCGHSWPPGQSVCAKCGSQNSTRRLHGKSTITPRGELSWMQERRKIIHKQPWIPKVLLVLELACVAGGFIWGQVIGATIGVVLAIVGYLVGPRIIHEVTRSFGKIS